PSPPSSPSATTSSAPSSLACAAPAWAASPHTGPESTAATRACAPACRNSSTTSASPRPPHRQHFVDHEKASELGRPADVAARSASPNLDPAPTRTDLGACEQDGPEQDSATQRSGPPSVPVTA